jgi:carbon monoxide dehydrogenase subunit G
VTGLPVRRRDPVIDYREEFLFPSTPDQVWEAIEQFDQFETWWSWLRTFRAERAGLVEGNVLHGSVAPPLTRRFRIDVRLGTCHRPCLVEAVVEGDLAGHARLALEPSGTGTCATVTWSLAMVRGPIRAAALVAYPVVRWAHDRVVETTVAGFRRHACNGTS